MSITAKNNGEVELKKGVVASIEYEGKYYPPREIDGGWSGIEREHYSEHMMVTIRIDGKDVCAARLGSFLDPASPIVTESKLYGWVPAEATLIATVKTPDDKLTNFAVTGSISCDELFAAAERIAAAARPQEIKRMKAAEASAERAHELAEARKIANCGNVFEDDEARAAWEKSYNNMTNEGGEGFVPMAVTRADVAWAKGVLATAKAEEQAMEASTESIADAERVTRVATDWIGEQDASMDELRAAFRLDPSRMSDCFADTAEWAKGESFSASELEAEIVRIVMDDQEW